MVTLNCHCQEPESLYAIRAIANHNSKRRMLSWFKKRKIVIKNKDELIHTMSRIVKILGDNDYEAQADAVRKPLKFLHNDDTTNFIKYLNTVDIWGGSGAAWEVYLQPKKLELEFMKCIVDLIEDLKQTGIKIRGTKSISNYFKEEISKAK